MKNGTLSKSYSIDSNIKPFQHSKTSLPYIFVCASSGTGKTQLPFALDIPLIYLLNNERIVKNSNFEETGKTPQQIYLNFVNISRTFKNCIKKDTKTRNKMDDFNDQTETMIAGFFVVLCREIMKMRKQYGNEHWAVSQLRIESSERIESMNYGNAAKELNLIFEGIGAKPVVFLDESQKDVDNQETFALEYKLVRRLIRQIGMIPVFMGTNACLANFVNFQGSSGSRDDQKAVWCYIVYKLAPPSQEFIQQEKLKVIESVNSCEASIDSKNKAVNFVTAITNKMKYERPFFCNLIFEQLNNNIKSITSSDFDPCKRLDIILWNVFYNFNSRKKSFEAYLESNNDFMNYNYSNISITSPEFWRKKKEFLDNTNKSTKDIKEYNIDKANGIHNHIAYLYASPSLKENLRNESFFALQIDDLHLKTFMISTSEKEVKSAKFQIEQIFAPFRDETLGQLAFVGSDNSKTVFIGPTSQMKGMDQSPYQRISSCKALNDINSKAQTISNHATKITTNWTTLEILSALSALIASHGNGFEGMNAELWLRHFLREINKNSNYEIELPEIKYPKNDQFINNTLKTIKIPFCSSTINAEWDLDFRTYLKSQGANLGTLYADLGKESRDFYIEFADDNEEYTTPISGECKYRKDDITIQGIEKVIERLLRHDSPINLIVVNMFKKEIKFDNIKQSFESNFRLYTVVNNEENQINLEMVYEYSKVKTDMRIFIIVEIKDVEIPNSELD